MKTVYEVIATLTKDIKSAFFIEKKNQTDLNVYSYQRLSFLTRTDSGNLRYAKKDIHACQCVINQLLQDLLNDFTVFCYQIDGELYTTYNKDNSFKYAFKGNPATITMKNYREAGKESRLMELSKDNNVVSGFYYPCGKPFFVSNRVK